MQMDRDFVKVDLALTLQRYVIFFVISYGSADSCKFTNTPATDHLVAQLLGI